VNKGVVVKILPADETPRDNNGNLFDIIINPNGIISRKNAGQLLELYTGRIVHLVNTRVQKLISSNKYKSAVHEIKNMYKQLLNETPHKKYVLEQLDIILKDKTGNLLNEYIEFINTNGVQLYLDPIDKLNIKRILKAMAYYRLKPKEKIYDPSIGGKTKTPVTFGYMYWEKTIHLSSKKLSARSIGPVQSTTGQAVKGSKNEGGQRIDELSVHTLLSYGVYNYLFEISTLSSDDLKTKYRAINKIYKNGKLRLSELKEDAKSTSAEQMKTILKAMGVIKPI